MLTNTALNTTNNFAAPLTENEIETFHNIIGVGQQVKSMTVLANAMTELAKQISELKRDAQIRANKSDDNLKEFIDSLVKSQDNVAATIKKQHETDRKQIYAINNNNKEVVKKFNPIFCSTLTKADQQSWHKIIEGDIERLHIDTGRGIANIHKDLYSGMRRLGHDVNKLLDNYKVDNPDASIMDMCMASDILRSSLSAQVEIMKYTNNRPAKKNLFEKSREDSTYTFFQANKSPAEMREIVARLSKNGKWSAWSSKKVLTALGEKVDVDSIVNNFKKSNHISKCNPWFAISKNKKAMLALNYMLTGTDRF